MNSKAFKEPVVPTTIREIEDVPALLNEAKETEEEITLCRLKGIFVTKFDAKKISFKRVVFENCRFISCFFDEASFTDVRFKNCDFSNTSLTDIYFKRCSFQSCKALGADMYGGLMRHVSFQDCNFSQVNLDASRMSYVKMNNMNLSEASLSKCGLDNVELHHVNLRMANFFKTILKGVDFSDTDMEGFIISDNWNELGGAIMNVGQAIDCAKRLGIVIKEMDL